MKMISEAVTLIGSPARLTRDLLVASYCSSVLLQLDFKHNAQPVPPPRSGPWEEFMSHASSRIVARRQNDLLRSTFRFSFNARSLTVRTLWKTKYVSFIKPRVNFSDLKRTSVYGPVFAFDVMLHNEECIINNTHTN